MGREIRRVPADWEHPRYTKDDAPSPQAIGKYRSLCDNDIETAAAEWLVGLAEWKAGTHENQVAGAPRTYAGYVAYWSSAPDPEVYRQRAWSEHEATHYQVYETVSEGTPVTPAFATKDELVAYLVKHGDFWDQKRGVGGWKEHAALRFVEDEYAPSLVVFTGASGTTVAAPRDGQDIGT